MPRPLFLLHSSGTLARTNNSHLLWNRMTTETSLEPSPRTDSPASSVEMRKPAVLLIGGITHAKKEWEECGDFAELKVFVPSLSCNLSSMKCAGRWLLSQTFNGTTRSEFLKACEDGCYSDVIAIYRSNESTAVSYPESHVQGRC